MNYKLLCVIGLIFLIIGQALLAMGFEFMQAQKPIDFAHWFILLGAALCISFNFVFPKGIINSISIFLTSLGVIAHIGMCAVDFVLWSYGADDTNRNQLVGHLMNTPSIWYPFFVIGPSLLYIGLATHAWKFIRTHTISAIVTLGGSSMIGLSQFASQNRIFVVIGCIIFALGLLRLIYRETSIKTSVT